MRERAHSWWVKEKGVPKARQQSRLHARAALAIQMFYDVTPSSPLLPLPFFPFPFPFENCDCCSLQAPPGLPRRIFCSSPHPETTRYRLVSAPPWPWCWWCEFWDREVPLLLAFGEDRAGKSATGSGRSFDTGSGDWKLRRIWFGAWDLGGSGKRCSSQLLLLSCSSLEWKLSCC